MSVSVEDDDQSGARLLQLGPGRKQVKRHYGAEDRMAGDIILGVCVRSDRFRRGLRAAAGFLLGCGAGVLGAGAAIALGFGRSISVCTLENIVAVVAGLALTVAVALW